MSTVGEFEHKGHTILSVTYTGMSKEDALVEVAELSSVIRASEPNSRLILSDFTDVHYDKATSDKFAEFAKGNKPFVKASAVIGMTGMKRVLFNTAMKIAKRDIRNFDTRDAALSWLIDQATNKEG